jgi:protein-L-isoaspartate(D-aspartate) O-methyltransferase
MGTSPARLDTAFRAVARRNFLPAVKQEFADIDMPLSIGYGQTNSQPSTVRRMLGWLDVRPGQTILDIGSGSGWTTALLAHLVGPAGQVHAVELIPELRKFGEANCEATGVTNAHFYASKEVFGLPEKAPYDRILVSASADTLPPELIEQLRPGGRLVIPIGNSIMVITKALDGTLEQQNHPGFTFVPLRRTDNR